MNRLDSIWNHARADLVILTDQGVEDFFLWEHSVRVGQSAQLIAELPVVRERSPDEVALLAAALYHDAGWITRWREGEVQRCEILVQPPSDAHRELGAVFLEETLAELLPATSLKRASAAIRALDNRRVEPIEGQVVAEAENLDEFGLLSLWPTIRRGLIEGKGVQAVIETWHRRKEYQFWSARLNESFRFAPIQKLAEARLAMYERMMGALEAHHGGKDVETVVGNAATPAPAQSATK